MHEKDFTHLKNILGGKYLFHCTLQIDEYGDASKNIPHYCSYFDKTQMMNLSFQQNNQKLSLKEKLSSFSYPLKLFNICAKGYILDNVDFNTLSYF